MKSRTLSLRLMLASVFVLNSTSASAKFGNELEKMIPDMSGISANPSDFADVTLAPSAQILIKQKVSDLRKAPSWVRRLQASKVADYFRSARPGEALPADGQEKLERDAVALSKYYEQDDSQSEFAHVPAVKIKPFIRSLTFAKLYSAVRNGKVTEPVAQWTVEGLVVRMHLASLAGAKDRTKRALEMISGRHLKAASKAGLALVVGGTLYYMFSDTGASFLAITVLATVVGAFKAGPLATLMNAATSWFINPTVEYVKVINNRYTAPIETRINNFFDRMKPASDNPVEESEANTTAKIANIEEDGTDFAGMTEAEQINNWSKLLGLWVGVCKHFYKLLRDTHHAGRALFNQTLSDEMGAALFMETLDTKLSVLQVEELQLLTPYQAALLARGDIEAKNNLDSAFDNFRDSCARTWTEELNRSEQVQLAREIRNLRNELESLGVSTSVVEKLWQIQIKRAHTAATLTTGLAVTQIKMLSNAEANRNLQAEAREAQRAVHRGLGIQRFVDTYRTKVSETHRRMGFQNSGKTGGKPACETLLETIMH